MTMLSRIRPSRRFTADRHDVPDLSVAAPTHPLRAGPDPRISAKADGVLTAPGGELHQMNPGIAAKAALIRKDGKLSFHAVENALASGEIQSFRHTAELALGERVPDPVPIDLRDLRRANIAQADQQLGIHGTEIRLRLVDLIEHAAAQSVNDVKLDQTADGTFVRFQKDNYLSDPIKKFTMAPEEANALITSAINYSDSGDPVEQPGTDQKFTITSPSKLPQNVQAIRGQTAVREDGRRLDLRIIYRTTAFSASGLADIGLLDEHLDSLYYVQSAAAGLFTITAPTDNGKSTTLNLFSVDMVRGRYGRIDVIGIDDPVEFMAPEICQLAMGDREGAMDPFAAKIHTTLRLAPHAVKVGECRTLDTANAAIDAAITGRLVMTTQHTTGAFGVPYRYERMGVDRHVAFDSEIHICWMSQRLVPTLCPHCRIPLTALPADFDRRRSAVIKLFRAALERHAGAYHVRGPGCAHCIDNSNMPGLGRRVLVAEVILPDRRLCAALAGGREDEARRRVIAEMRTPTMAIHGFRYLQDGRVGLEEYAHAIASPSQLADDLDARTGRSFSAAAAREAAE